MKEKISSPKITRDHFVGRRHELAMIKEAISDKKRVRLLIMQGSRGIGKTTILRRILKRYSKHEGFKPDEFKLDEFKLDDLLVLDIIDFFDIENTPRGFFDRVVEALSDKNEQKYFESYITEREKADEIEFANITGIILDDQIKKYSNEFIRCYNRLTCDRRIVLLIDTFETVTNEFQNWLATCLADLKNTAVITAVRDNVNWIDDWQENLIKSLGKEQVTPIDLMEFGIEDTQELIKIAGAESEINDEELEKMQILCAGRPILLIMSVDRQWPGALHGIENPEIMQTEISQKYSLDDLNQMTEKELEPVRNTFRIELIKQGFQQKDLYSVAWIILFMALAYRYFTAEMLAHLMKTTEQEAQKHLDFIRKWCFTRYDNRLKSYRLHGLVRELIMDYVWSIIEESGKKRKEISDQLFQFYKNKLNDIKNERERLSEARTKAKISNNKKQERKFTRELNDLKIRHQHYEAQQTYFAIIADYNYGIICYKLAFIYNLWVRETYANTLLKQERDNALQLLGQKYPEHEARLDDAKEKIVIKGEFSEGLNILKNEVPREDDPYFFSDVLLYQAIAYNYKGDYEQAKEKFQNAIFLFEDIRNSLKEPDNYENLETRRVTRSLARSYGQLGFGCFQAGRLSESIEAYLNALPYSKLGEIEAYRAYLLNDLAFIHSRLGNFERARFYWKEGLKIRENLLFDYPIGLSYNVGGLIEYFADSPDRGINNSKEALTIFKRIGDQRGAGLALRSLGGLQMRIGQLEKSVELLKKAEHYLQEAEDIFKKGGPFHEPTHLAETYDRMGLLYSHWWNILKEQGAEDDLVKEYFSKSESCFERSLYEYKNEKSALNIATVQDRLCRLFIEAGNFDKAENELKSMESILSKEMPESVIHPDDKEKKIMEEFHDIPQELIYPLGKMEQKKGRIAFEHYNKNKTINHLKKGAEHYTLAYSYLEYYSKESFAARDTLREISEIIKELGAKEINEFKNKVKQTQQAKGMEKYSEIVRRIEDAEAVSGI